ncbi:MAG: ribosome biogenesis GTP-binding protein YihA/YsxC [Rickettsiales bacterium]|nr:ribosome biogenesis GTP-binding protein YihA/YsxC [Rickettsiales bacterium]
MDSEKLFLGPCEFVAGAATEDAIPPLGLTEVAFAGRSNVGKSSLLNALTNRKSLARTSQNPGRTQQLNFFNLADCIMLVDLPGYGYAKASKSKVKDWSKLTLRYLRGRPQLRRVFLLVDSRHDPKPIDEEYMGIFDDAAVSYTLVLTKCDKLGPNQLSSRIAEYVALARKHPAAIGEVVATSSENGLGLSELRAIMTALI